MLTLKKNVTKFVIFAIAIINMYVKNNKITTNELLTKKPRIYVGTSKICVGISIN